MTRFFSVAPCHYDGKTQDSAAAPQAVISKSFIILGVKARRDLGSAYSNWRSFRFRLEPACHLAAPDKLWAVANRMKALCLSVLTAAALADSIYAQTSAEFDLHVTQLTKQVPEGFTVVAQPPFVVLGDESPEVVRQRATQTVKWAVDKLKQDYFERDPQEVIDIWLFRDGSSYTNHARSLFVDTPASRFGYYSAAHQALVMNISTGGGTLVHEIVHPFMRANFQKCPAWFNEGLASLYEASAEKDGHIQGTINWRLKGLEKAIKEGRTISFQKLTSMTEGEFYGGDSYSQYYAQARYLCYYLQQKGLLVKFYHQFVAEAQSDPTGYATLKRVLGESDMQAFQKKWEKFILGLRGL